MSTNTEVAEKYTCPECGWVTETHKDAKIWVNDHRWAQHREEYTAELTREDRLAELTKRINDEGPGGYTDINRVPVSSHIFLEFRSAQLDNLTYNSMANFEVVDLHLTKQSTHWLTEGAIDVGVEILADITDCPSHRIAIFDITISRAVYHLGSPLFPNETGIPDDNYRGDRSVALPILGNVKERFINRDFFFIPLTNGWSDKVHKGIEEFSTTGSHWSLLAVDYRGAPNKVKFRYFDSFGSSHRKIAEDMALGVCMFLDAVAGQTTLQDSFKRTDVVQDPYMPGQLTHDVSGKGGMSACGVFVWAAIRELVLYIVECREYNLEVGEIAFTKEFRKEARWNSLDIRTTIDNLIWEARRIQEERGIRRYKTSYRDYTRS